MLKVYNTLTKKKEEFIPLKNKEVKIFVCGPTVFDYIHIGNARTFTNYDLIVKYLRYRGYKVKYIQNITDIDDKIINKAKKTKTTWKAVSEKYTKAFLEDIKHLNITSVDKYAKATHYIPNIISQVKRLLEKGYAYIIENDGIYFDISKDKDYGKLSGRTVLQAEDAISRIDESINKRNKGDFCLWKFPKKDDPFWESELGKGRPGWHIEDTAITEKELGPQYDIHGGAIDLIFPHHEAEIAQMESITGIKPFVKYWLHSGFLNLNKEKMSKSLGNVFTLREALKKYEGPVIRFLFISSHYRTPLEFNESSLEQAKLSLQRIREFMENAKNSKINIEQTIIEKAKQDFLKAMDDDFNTPKALAAIFKLIRKANKLGYGKNSYNLLKDLDKILSLNLSKKQEKIPKEVKELAEKRLKLRLKKDFKSADKLREEIKNKGFIIEDTKDGYKLKRIN
jgi:cysteinyl-tRNA synthetase